MELRSALEIGLGRIYILVMVGFALAVWLEVGSRRRLGGRLGAH